MIKLNIISAWRNLKKNKIVSVTNILGLTIGLTCAIFAIVFSYHELSYENCYEKADQICRVYTYGNFGSLEKIPTSFGAAAEVLKTTFPEIETATRSKSMNGTVYKDNKPINENDIIIAEESIFDVLSFNFIIGHKFTEPGTIVISDKIARKYFGSKDAVNNTLRINIWGEEQDYTIVGVFKDLPSNTHAKASIIMPFNMAYRLNLHPDENWSTEYAIYTLLSPGTDLHKLNNKIAKQIEIPVPIENIKYALVPIKRIHIFENPANNAKGNLLMILIGGFIALAITIFNYINSTTLMFSSRMKEIGIRKTNGGSRRNIFIQFMADSGLSVTISFILAIFIFKVLSPFFNNLLDTDIETGLDWISILILSVLYVFTIILSSLYPALKSLRVKTATMIRETSQIIFSKNRISNVLITVQFVVAILFLQFIIITQKQTTYMFDQDVIKFNADNVISLNGWEWGDLNTIKQELLKNSSIEKVSWGQVMPAANFNMSSDWKESGNKEMANIFSVGEDYLDLFKIDLKEGHFFTDKFTSDEKNGVVINPLTANSLGYENPVGQQLLIHGKMYTIIGVTEDYMSVPPIFDKMPLLMKQSGNRDQHLLIRVNPDLREEAHKHIEKVLSVANPAYPIEIKYYDDITYENAKSYVATGIFINIFTIIILFNAMMGLFSLSFFIAAKKNKEIGIRKVFGATIKSVYWNLSRGFIKKLVLALVITFPLGYIMGGQYLTTFTNRIELDAGIFLLAGLLALLMVIVSTGWKVVQVALQNPSEVLKYE